ncbi:TRAP-type C4-dicarboxylate transport system, substrate-binding protein [Paracoccus halophilus]|uniref:TRAP-type C4-dicarboxylate transport system, substrate-binding protein n=1 Tax=Paracoccus halophilus TaxID=376733 RepID=A0A099EXX6_9RHOB|nr:TRAP transporter substrate-binding protein DctP [Paracoccus halophilus]KGJ03024.1 hypothetical protein IT41_15530 [Paracoccus halophilus]SFA50419.1 TRAP-type C4-dicarboxylate transport system, substrate-binding protein [Paracoccus halophilus]
MQNKTIMAVLASVIMVASPAIAETTLRAFIPVTETRPEARMFNETFADKVAELTNGEVTVQTFYAGGLGFEVRDLLRHLKRGTVDIGNILGAYYSRDAESLTLMLVDGGITRSEDITAYRDVFAEEFEKSLERWDTVFVGTTQPLVLDHSIFCKQPVTSLDQLKAMKLRVWTKHQLESFQSLGVAAQMISQEDLYIALQTGVVDCAVYLGEVATLMGLQEVAPYETYFLPYISAPAAIGVSEKAWNQLTEAQQAALREAGQNATEETTRMAIEFSQDKAASRAEREAKGIVITEGFSEADRTALVETMQATWRAMAEDAGSETLQVVERVMEIDP